LRTDCSQAGIALHPAFRLYCLPTGGQPPLSEGGNLHGFGSAGGALAGIIPAALDRSSARRPGETRARSAPAIGGDRQLLSMGADRRTSPPVTSGTVYATRRSGSGDCGQSFPTAPLGGPVATSSRGVAAPLGAEPGVRPRGQ